MIGALGGNWSGGVAPGQNDDVILDGTSTVQCNCALTGTVANSITINTGYNGQNGAGRLNFTSSSGTTVNIGAGGLQMHDGGIEQISGNTIELDGNSTVDGGCEINSENTTLGILKVPSGKTYSVTATGKNTNQGDLLDVYGEVDFNITQARTLVFSNDASLFVNPTGLFKWQTGNVNNKAGSGGAFLNEGTVDYTDHGNASTDEVEGMTFIQQHSTVQTDPGPKFQNETNASPNGDITNTLEFTATATGANPYAFDALAGTVNVTSTVHGVNSTDTFLFKMTNTKLHIGGGSGYSVDFKVYGAQATQIDGNSLLADAGTLEIGPGSQLLLKNNTAYLKGSMTLQIHAFGATSGSCGTLTAKSVEIDATNATLTATSDSQFGQWVGQGSWTFLSLWGTGGSITVDHDFGTKNPPTNGSVDESHATYWQFLTP